jgi:DNA-binding CsgD family transcriptional regulator
MRLQWPLTGRSEEMRIIAAALSDTDITGIVMSGAAGVGKSRIAREALGRAASIGAQTRWTVATSSARALPLGAFASFISPDAGDTLHLVRSVIESLTAAPTGTRVVVAVDDAHLLDELSTFVLHQILQRRAAKVILTARSGEQIPQGIREIWEDGSFERIDLQPISRDESSQLLTAALRGPVDLDSIRRLWNLTRGNPLFLRNIVEQEVADRRLEMGNSYWAWKGEPILPSNLVEMIETRTGALPDPVNEVLDVLAVAEPLELTTLYGITDAAAVEEAESRGLIKLDHSATRIEVRVAHPLYAEVRRNRAPETRLRRLRGRVATELAACDERDDMRTVVRRATLSLDSDLQPDPQLLVTAARGAVWLADLPLADRLSDAAIRAGGKAQAKFIRGCILSGLSRGEDAETVLADVPTSDLTDEDHAELAFIRGMNMLYTLADPAAAQHLVNDAAWARPPQPGGCIDAFLTVYWAALGKPEAARIAAQHLRLNRLPAIVAAQTAALIARASGDAGRTTEALAAADAGYAIIDGSFDAAHLRFVVADGHVDALQLAGNIGEAMDAAERLRKQSADLPGVAQPLGWAVAGRAALSAGHLDRALPLLQPMEMLATGESNGWGYRYELSRTIALAIHGSTREATAALAATEKLRHPSWASLDYELGRARAWVAASRGILSEAVSIVLSAAESASANGQFAAEVICLQAATQFGKPADAVRLQALTELVEGPRARVATRFAAALQSGDAAELSAVSEAFEQIGDLVAAIDAAAYAAAAYQHVQLRGSASICASRAENLAQQCGGASTPALRRITDHLPLTGREREIAILLAEGFSIRQMAERLTLSARTIENHIYRAMAKTGVTSRADLAKLAPRRTPPT